MLEKKNRITLNKEFDHAFTAGQSFYAKEFGIKAVTNNLGVSRVGLLVGLKISKKAVIRNKIKRQIRAIISKEISLLVAGKDIVIIALPKIVFTTFSELKELIQFSLKKLKLYK